MFPSLAAEIHALEVPADAAAIVAAVALRDQLDARVADAIGEFARAGGHELDGSVTLGSWLSHRAGMDPRSATREARRDQRLARLPVLRAAFLDGRLSAGAVEVILARVPARHLARFGEHEAELIPLLVDLDVQQLARAMADWRAKADALDPGPVPVELPDTVHLSPTIEDRCQLDGSLGPDLAAVVATAFRVYDCGDLSLPVAERRALALGQICQVALDFNPGPKVRRHRPHVTVTIREDGSATYLDVLTCDAAWHTLTFEGRAAILRYGRAMRDWPAELYNAIAIRDAGCRWPGCTAPVHWCDVHHVHHWEDGGTTDIDNGLLLCRRHHRKLHSKQGWALKLLPDGTAELTHPTGEVEPSHPTGLDPPRLPLPPV